MKKTYPVVMTPGEKFTVVYIPDFNINTQGTDNANALDMARDAIVTMAADLLEEGQPLPASSSLPSVQESYPDADVALVTAELS